MACSNSLRSDFKRQKIRIIPIAVNSFQYFFVFYTKKPPTCAAIAVICIMEIRFFVFAPRFSKDSEKKKKFTTETSTTVRTFVEIIDESHLFTETPMKK